MFIKALHTFATSYLSGNAKITEEAADGEQGDQSAAPANAKDGSAAAKAADSSPTTITTKKLECSPEQREKVTATIGAYVQSVPPAAPQAGTPAPVAGGAN
jgi:hypothetical protein